MPITPTHDTDPLDSLLDALAGPGTATRTPDPSPRGRPRAGERPATLRSGVGVSRANGEGSISPVRGSTGNANAAASGAGREGRTRLVWRDSPLQDLHPVADVTDDSIPELKRRIVDHQERMGYNAFAADMDTRPPPRSIDELRAAARRFLEERNATSPIFQPDDVYLTASGGPQGRAFAGTGRSRR